MRYSRRWAWSRFLRSGVIWRVKACIAVVAHDDIFLSGVGTLLIARACKIHQGTDSCRPFSTQRRRSIGTGPHRPIPAWCRRGRSWHALSQDGANARRQAQAPLQFAATVYVAPIWPRGTPGQLLINPCTEKSLVAICTTSIPLGFYKSDVFISPGKEKMVFTRDHCNYNGLGDFARPSNY